MNNVDYIPTDELLPPSGWAKRLEPMSYLEAEMAAVQLGTTWFYALVTSASSEKVDARLEWWRYEWGELFGPEPAAALYKKCAHHPGWFIYGIREEAPHYDTGA